MVKARQRDGHASKRLAMRLGFLRKSGGHGLLGFFSFGFLEKEDIRFCDLSLVRVQFFWGGCLIKMLKILEILEISLCRSGRNQLTAYLSSFIKHVWDFAIRVVSITLILQRDVSTDAKKVLYIYICCMLFNLAGACLNPVTVGELSIHFFPREPYEPS